MRREQHAKRHRRLQPGEEANLLKAATPWLQRLIIAALETACRRGELLSLQWKDVDLERGEFTVQADKTKTGTERVLPISARLRAVMDMVKLDPAGQRHPPLAYVFGDAIGRQVGSPATAWETCVLKAHGHPVKRQARSHALQPETRASLRAVDLHFHDLRHEAGSRMLEAGWPLHHIQQMLGHADLKQTSTYLNVTRTGLQESMRRFGTTPLQSVANTLAGEASLLRNENADEEAKPLIN